MHSDALCVSSLNSAVRFLTAFFFAPVRSSLREPARTRFRGCDVSFLAKKYNRGVASSHKNELRA